MSKTTFTLKRKLYAIPGLGFGSQAFKQISKNNSFGKNLWQGTKGTLGAVGSTALVGTALVGAGALAAKGVVNKASEQSDGSKMFSQVKNNDMATTYTLKRKTYSTLLMDNQGRVINGADSPLPNASNSAFNSLEAGFDKKSKREQINTSRAASQKSGMEKIGSREGWGGTHSNYSGGVSTAEAVKAAQKRTASQVGIKQGFKNSWGRMGTLGKAGVIGAGVAATGLMAKGLLSGNKKKDQQQ